MKKYAVRLKNCKPKLWLNDNGRFDVFPCRALFKSRLQAQAAIETAAGKPLAKQCEILFVILT